MTSETWEKKKVCGRDEVMRDIERRARRGAEETVLDIMNVMRNYEVDLFRYLLAVGDRFGRDTAFAIQSDTVAKMRVRWVDENREMLIAEGSLVDRGCDVLIKYYKLDDNDLNFTEKTNGYVVFKRREYVDMITYTCKVLELDTLEVVNKIYARATNIMLEKISPLLRYTVLDYKDGWYTEKIEVICGAP